LSLPLEFRFPPALEHLRSLRRHLRQKLQESHVSVETADSVILVLDEIVTNAIEHADSYRNESGWLLVRLDASGTDVLFEFEDPDVPTDVVDALAATLANSNEDHPPIDNERGRGLFLVALNIDDLKISHRPDGGLHLHGRFGAIA